MGRKNYSVHAGRGPERIGIARLQKMYGSPAQSRAIGTLLLSDINEWPTEDLDQIRANIVSGSMNISRLAIGRRVMGGALRGVVSAVQKSGLETGLHIQATKNNPAIVYAAGTVFREPRNSIALARSHPGYQKIYNTVDFYEALTQEGVLDAKLAATTIETDNRKRVRPRVSSAYVDHMTRLFVTMRMPEEIKDERTMVHDRLGLVSLEGRPYVASTGSQIEVCTLLSGSMPPTASMLTEMTDAARSELPESVSYGPLELFYNNGRRMRDEL